MKQANNNEVDLLLRSLARRRGAPGLQSESSSGDGNPAGSAHLDADELNSYAEGVVPIPARARYTEHLADCDICRGMVISLRQAAGIAARSKAPEQKDGLGLWQKLAALFSPVVLRYAVPALVLTAVIGIGLLAMWQQRGRPEFLARNQPADESASTSQLKQTEATTSQSPSEAPATAQKSDSTAALDSHKEENILRDEKTRAAQGAGTGTGELAANAPVAKGSGQAGETSKLELRPGYAPEPKAAAPPPAASLGEANESTRLAKEQPAKREDQERRRMESRDAPTDEHGPNRSAAPRPTGALLNNRQLDGLSAGSGPNIQSKKNKAGDKAGDVETRTVSGRRFAREGNAWVDTAYDSSRTPIKVARGSEQFRALVADEPELRAIAEHLNGVVIVVWKNRVYRIQ
jgi:cytoskeletal protein RodZ